jgi:hypothetical protein
MRFSELTKLNEAKEVFYHGSNTQITQFTTEFIGKGDGSDQEGPGIYLTSSADDAKKYGKYIHVVDAKVVKSRLLRDSVKTREHGIRLMIYKAPDKDDILTDWDENPERAYRKAVEGIMDSYPDCYREALEQVWADFYPNDAEAYLSRLRGWGYQGFKLDRSDGIVHFICWDPSILTIREIL